MLGKTSIEELAAALTKDYAHLELAQVNDHGVYVMHFSGEFPFHQHTKDELYLVLEGEIKIRFRNQPEIVLKKNECTVVHGYTIHSPSSEKGALVLMMKPKGMFANPVTSE